MAVAAMLAGAVHQTLDLALREIAPLDCQVYDAWGAFLGCRFHADEPYLRVSYCIGYTPLLNSQSIAISLGIGAHATILWLSVLSGPPPSMRPSAPLNRGRGWIGCEGNARAARSSAMEIISVPFETPGGGGGLGKSKYIKNTSQNCFFFFFFVLCFFI